MNLHVKRYLLAGVLALTPIWVTWVVFNFVLAQLSRAGRPWVQALALPPWLESLLAVLVTLAALYLIGWATTRVIGRRLFHAFENLLERVPLAKVVYRLTKQLIDTLRQRPEGVQRVVLIRFPHRDIKTVPAPPAPIRSPTKGQAEPRRTSPWPRCGGTTARSRGMRAHMHRDRRSPRSCSRMPRRLARTVRTSGGRTRSCRA